MIKIKDKYIDHYGIDSLKHLKIAVKSGADIFLTSNIEMLKDREELEKHFTIEILTPPELYEREEKNGTML